MDLHIKLDRDRPLRAQVEHKLRDAIRTGRLRPGARLPASRMLAQELGVSRGVVVEAYSQLTAEGYVVTRYGGGTRVAPERGAPPARRRAKSARPRYELRSGIPDMALFPRRAWAVATSRVLRELPDSAFAYGRGQGLSALRVALADYLGRVRALVLDADQVFITSGSNQALALLWQTLRRQGATRVGFEDPGWSILPACIERAGLEAVPVPVDHEGLVVEALYGLAVDAVVVSPAHQYPTGVTMSQSRRAQIVAWARETGALIVEDDYDAEYRFDGEPVAPLQSGAPRHVAYVGTASKTFAPGVRLGWLIAPGHLTDALVAERRVNYAQPSSIDQAAYASLLQRGDVDRHLRKTRRIYRARRELMIEAIATFLPEVVVAGTSAGLHLMLWLPAGTDERRASAEAARRGIVIDALAEDFATYAPRPPGIVVGYGAISEALIPSAIRELASSVCIAAR
jgi:GntR family transcriptional regulator / MocR family aminotransferase